MIEERLSAIETELGLIKERNARVESDKAWEISITRITSICALTYLSALLLLYMIGNDACFLNALVPVLGFFLSSLSLPAIKKRWQQRRTK